MQMVQYHYLLIFQQENYLLNIMTLQVNASKELPPIFIYEGFKTGSVLLLDSITKLLDFKYETNRLGVKVTDELDLKAGNSLSSSINGIDI